MLYLYTSDVGSVWNKTLNENTALLFLLIHVGPCSVWTIYMEVKPENECRPSVYLIPVCLEQTNMFEKSPIIYQCSHKLLYSLNVAEVAYSLTVLLPVIAELF